MLTASVGPTVQAREQARFACQPTRALSVAHIVMALAITKFCDYHTDAIVADDHCLGGARACLHGSKIELVVTTAVVGAFSSLRPLRATVLKTRCRLSP